MHKLLLSLPTSSVPKKWPTTYEKVEVQRCLLEEVTRVEGQEDASTSGKTVWWKLPYDADFMDRGWFGPVESLYLLRLLGLPAYKQVVAYLRQLPSDALLTPQEWTVFMLEQGEALQAYRDLPATWWFPTLYPGRRLAAPALTEEV